ncbi:MAG: hypothetical protein ACK4ST_01755, partial [Elioraea tepidiphila]
MILHQAVPPDAPPDEQDVLEQVGAVEAALIEAGWRTRRLAAGLDLAAVAGALADDRPDLVINLVESLTVGRAAGVMAPTAAALLESLGLAFTGNTAAALALTADKLATKRVLRATGIATPPWIERDGAVHHPRRGARGAIGEDADLPPLQVRQPAPDILRRGGAAGQRGIEREAGLEAFEGEGAVALRQHPDRALGFRHRAEGALRLLPRPGRDLLGAIERERADAAIGHDQV